MSEEISLPRGSELPTIRVMSKPSPFCYFKTSPEIIRLAVMLYVRFPLSLRNVEDLLHERGIDICHETVRQWWMRFGQTFAAEIRRKRVSRPCAGPQWRWHVDEVFVKLNGERHYLWRALDHEGEVLEALVTKTPDRKAALKFLRKLMEIGGTTSMQVCDQHLNNRAENSHLPFRRRERAMLRFRRMRSLQKFVAVHASGCNHFNQDRSLSRRQDFMQNRDAALDEWRQFGAA